MQYIQIHKNTHQHNYWLILPTHKNTFYTYTDIAIPTSVTRYTISIHSCFGTIIIKPLLQIWEDWTQQIRKYHILLWTLPFEGNMAYCNISKRNVIICKLHWSIISNQTVQIPPELILQELWSRFLNKSQYHNKNLLEDQLSAVQAFQ